MNVTIKDIAESASVSQMTVSRVLRGVGRVSDDTRERVRNAAASLGYSSQSNILFPNRTRNGKRNRNLRLVIPFFGDSGLYFLTHEAESPTRKDHLSLSQRFNNSLKSVLEETGGWLQKVMVECIDEFENSWSRWDFDGIILRQPIPSEWINRLQSLAPVVYASSYETQEGVDAVYTNEYRSATKIFTHLCDNGHKNIVWFDIIHENDHYVRSHNNYIGSDLPLSQFPPPITSIRHASWAMIKFHSDENFRNEILLMKRDYRKFTILDVAKEALELVLEMQPVPTAVVCAHDNISVAMLEVAKDKGLSVPDDISLVGYCGFEGAVNSDPSITTIELPMEEIGAVMPELVERRIANPDAIALSLQFETKLLKGNSVKKIK